MADDRATDIFHGLDAEQRQPLLWLLSAEARLSIQALMRYPPNTAGALMTTEFVAVPADWTVGRTLQHIREVERSRETVYAIYLLDPHSRVLTQVVTMRRLITGAPEAPILDVAQVNPPVTVDPALDQEEVARLIRRHDLLAIPVVDAHGHVLGIVTVDDVLDALIAESTEDVHKFGGMEALDKPYMQIGFGQMIKKRAGWLSVLFLGEMLTASAMQHFEDELSKAVVLTLFIPLIMSSGGNSGSQATSLLIRSLALREPAPGRLVEGGAARAADRAHPGHHPGHPGDRAHHHLADRRPVRLRPALADGGADHRRGADRHRHLRLAVRLDAAVRAATARLRPGQRLGTVRGHAGGCHRAGDLFQHCRRDPQRHLVVAQRAGRAEVAPRRALDEDCDGRGAAGVAAPLTG